MANDSPDEFDVDEFLASASGARVQQMITDAVETGARRAYWAVFWTWVLLASVWIVASLLIALLTG